MERKRQKTEKSKKYYGEATRRKGYEEKNCVIACVVPYGRNG